MSVPRPLNATRNEIFRSHPGAWWYVRQTRGERLWYRLTNEARPRSAWTSDKTKARPMSLQRAVELAQQLVGDFVLVPANKAAEHAEADKEFVRAVFLAAGRTNPQEKSNA